MSKVYDEFLAINNLQYAFPSDYKPSATQRINPALAREIRDRSIMMMLKRAYETDYDIPYDELLRYVDNNGEEFHHETSDEEKNNQTLSRENRDRSIMMIMQRACEKGYDISYGELLRYVDNKDEEFNYERSKQRKGSLRV